MLLTIAACNAAWRLAGTCAVLGLGDTSRREAAAARQGIRFTHHCCGFGKRSDGQKRKGIRRLHGRLQDSTRRNDAETERERLFPRIRRAGGLQESVREEEAEDVLTGTRDGAIKGFF